MKLEYEIALEMFWWGLETFTRRDAGWILAGYRRTSNDRELKLLLERWRAQRLIQQEGRGRTARFTITAAGRRRVHLVDPRPDWDRRWDGQWRAFLFDLPSDNQQRRMALWRGLRAHRFGLLQRSVWVWPHSVESILQDLVQAQGIPECFCGFEVRRLFLCTDAEIVATAWDWKEIARRQKIYLEQLPTRPEAVVRARDLHELGRIAWAERDARAYAFSLDPLLPRVLWPRGYQGPALAARLDAFRTSLSRRLQALAA